MTKMRFDLGGQGDDAIFLLMPGFIVDLYLYIYIHILLWCSWLVALIQGHFCNLVMKIFYLMSLEPLGY